MATIRTRNLLTGSAIAMLMSAGAAFAQDATIIYETPIIQSGQPINNGVPVITKVPVQTLPVEMEAGATTPVTQATIDDVSYLGIPTVQTSSADQSVSFVSGGTGASEKSWFNAHSKEFSLKVSYNDTTGHNLAGVNATLTDSKGAQVLNTTTEGPFLLVKAQPGTYTLTSTYEGQSQSKKLTLGKGTTSVGVRFTDGNPDM